MYITSSLPSVAAFSGLQGEVDLGAPGQREQDFGDVEFSSMAVMRATGSQEQQQERTPEVELCHQGIIHSGPLHWSTAAGEERQLFKLIHL